MYKCNAEGIHYNQLYWPITTLQCGGRINDGSYDHNVSVFFHFCEQRKLVDFIVLRYF